MLTLLVKAVSYLIGKPELEEEVIPAPVEDNPKTAEVRQFSSIGKITSMHDGYGLIDGTIYFDISVVMGSALPKAGASVHLSAKLSPNTEGWVAESVQILSENWEDGCGSEGPDNDDDAITGMERSTIGRIQDIRQNLCYINRDLCLDLTASNVIDFTPEVGDWVIASICYTDSSNQCANPENVSYDLRPLRCRDFHGQVTQARNDYGLIDDDIYFLPHQFVHLRVGDTVRGVAIESSSGKWEWRATKIIPHLTAERKSFLRHGQKKVQDMSALVLDKNGISITSPLDFGILCIGERKSITANINNSGRMDSYLKQFSFQDETQNQLWCKVLPMPDEKGHKISPRSPRTTSLCIPSGGEANVNITCMAKSLGKFKEMLTFDFGDFQIGRTVFFSVRDENHSLLKGNCIDQRSTVQRSPRSQLENVSRTGTSEEKTKDWVIRGRAPQARSLKLPVHLPMFVVPKELLKCVTGEKDLSDAEPVLLQTIAMQNYQKKFSALLHLEEIQQAEDMRQFDMYRACLREQAEFLVLEVPGLSEGRPSLIVGDKVVLEDPDELQEPKYQGFVHAVRGNDILLKFHEDFHSRFSGKDYNVSFPFSRTTMRRCHQAVSLHQRVGSHVLFARSTSLMLRPARCRYDPRSIINKVLNHRQRCAVRGILEARRRPAPYVIYGPPGTGKTVTLVEAVIQIFQTRLDSRILVCTPSNSAGDLVCERLHLSGLFSPTDMIRWNAFHRLEKDLPPTIQRYCDPSTCAELVSRHRIIVATCVMSGLLYNLGIRPGHFTHVFIDEAGQATEPEVLVSICLAAAQGTEDFQVVLAGDPMQLGPVLRSKWASSYGLGTSFLERLCQSGPYLRDESQEGKYDPHLVTKLTDNYRSHPALIALPSEVFYHAELVPRASTDVALSLTHWSCLPNAEFPVVFHGIRGEDLQEGDSPSWFNSEEAFQVVRYLQSLYNDLGLNPEDVGIITPYRKQVEKINLLLRSLGTVPPKVGSIEEFQGQERRAILLSTVRSSDDWLSFDHMHNLGFLSNPKRFNVALTRAQALLVIVGNPFVLMKDFYWRTLIRFCIANGAYVGCSREELADLLVTTETDGS